MQYPCHVLLKTAPQASFDLQIYLPPKWSHIEQNWIDGLMPALPRQREGGVVYSDVRQKYRVKGIFSTSRFCTYFLILNVMET